MKIETYIEKDNKILISSPHEIEHRRSDINVIKVPETNMVKVREYIIKNKLANCIWLKENDYEDDVAWTKNNEYKEKIREILKKNKQIKYLIDIHGCKRERPQYICLCTNIFKNSDYELIRRAVENFSRYNKGVTIDTPFKNTRETLIPTWCKTTNGINSIGIEINSRVFDNQENEEEFKKSMKEFLIDLQEEKEKELVKQHSLIN